MADEKYVYKKPKTKVHVFDVINYIVFILIGLLVLIPLWKVIVDSFNQYEKTGSHSRWN